MAFDPKTALTEIAKGNSDAFAFMWNLLGWVHTLDDLIDQDPPPPLERVLESHLCFINTLSSNKFFIEHSSRIFPLLLAGNLAHIESERYRKSDDVVYRMASQVLKSQYQDVFFYTAFLVGGFQHMVEMSRRFRDYHFDPVPPPQVSG